MKMIRKKWELPERWGEKIHADRRKYYYNSTTRKTQWKRPEGSRLVKKKDLNVFYIFVY
jgi:hypothetical protein